MLVRESISFKKYRDPKEALGLSIGFDDIEKWMESETRYKFSKESPSNLWICAEYEKYTFVSFLLSTKIYGIETINRSLYEALENIHKVDEEAMYLTVKKLIDNDANLYKGSWSTKEFDSMKDKYPKVYSLVIQYINK